MTYLPPVAEKVRRFTADEPRTHNQIGSARHRFSRQDIPGRHAPRRRESRDGQRARLCSRGDDDRIRLKSPNGGRGDLLVQDHLHAVSVQASPHIVREAFDLLPPRRNGGQQKLPAQTGALLDQGDVMTPFPGTAGRLHPRGSGADDDHPFGGVGLRDGGVGLFSQHRVHGTTDSELSEDPLVASFVAGDAGPDLLLPALRRLLRQLGIGEKGAADCHDIRLALRQDFLGQCDGVDPAHGDDGDLQRLLEFRGNRNETSQFASSWEASASPYGPRSDPRSSFRPRSLQRRSGRRCRHPGPAGRCRSCR